MRISPLLILTALLPPTIAQADKVLLADGRVLVGEYRSQGSTVYVESQGQTHQVDSSQVLEVISTQTLTTIFDQSLAEMQLGDLEAMEELARQGLRDGLDERARQVWEAILQIDPEHAEARQHLGYLRLGEKWLTFPEVLEGLGERIRTEPEDASLLETLSDLRSRLNSEAQRFALTEMRGRILLARKEFQDAGAIFKLAAEAARQANLPDASVRFDVLHRIVSQAPAGVYALEDPYPAGAMLLGSDQRILRPGPVSLADPMAIEAALRDEALSQQAHASELISQAVAAENLDPDTARAKYLRAELTLDRADALLPGSGLTYRVEIARKRIRALRRDVENRTRGYDRLEARLGDPDLGGARYRRLLERMVHRLDSLEEALGEIIEIAQPYREELILQIQWAKSDLQTVQEKRTILKDEIDDR